MIELPKVARWVCRLFAEVPSGGHRWKSELSASGAYRRPWESAADGGTRVVGDINDINDIHDIASPSDRARSAAPVPSLAGPVRWTGTDGNRRLV